MILTGLADMGIPHEGATINMVAGRSPTGITAEIKLVPKEARNVSKTDDYTKTVVDERSVVEKAPVAEDGVKGNVGDNHSDNTGVEEVKPSDDEPEDDTSLFDK